MKKCGVVKLLVMLSWALLAVMMTNIALASPVSGLMSNGLQIGSSPGNGSLTVHTTFGTNAAWEPLGGGESLIILAGLTAKPETGPVGLLLTWSYDASGWFPRWVLQLRSEDGWNPASAVRETAKPVDATGIVELAAVTPSAGHVYNTVLSFSGATGEGNLSIVDSTDGKVIYSGSFNTVKTTAKLYPLVGASERMLSATTGLEQSIVSTTNVYTPVGVTWQLCGANSSNCLGNLLFQSGEQLIIELTKPIGPLDGVFRVWAETSDARTMLASFKSESLTTARQPLAPLPIGKSTVSVEYVEDGSAIWTDSRAITNGAVDVVDGDVAVVREQEVVTGSFYLKGVSMPAIPLDVQATIYRLVWSKESKSYKEQPYRVCSVFSGMLTPSMQPVKVVYSIAMPKEQGLYKVVLDATSSVGVAVRVTSPGRSFNTFLPAEVTIQLGI